MTSSWKWGVPIAVVVLLIAAGGGIALRTLDADANEASARHSSDSADSSLVEISFSPEALAHPDQPTVRWLLERYFNAINVKQYDTWRTTVVEARAKEMPQEGWKQSYASTQDRDVRVLRIDPDTGDSLRVMAEFTSIQDPASAPSNMRAGCIRWRVTLPLVQDLGSLRLDTGGPGRALIARC